VVLALHCAHWRGGGLVDEVDPVLPLASLAVLLESWAFPYLAKEAKAEKFEIVLIGWLRIAK
jgi:hypothetical protein